MFATRKLMVSGFLLASLSGGDVLAQGSDLISLYRHAVNYDADIAAAKSAFLAEQESENLALASLLPSLNASASRGHTNGNNSPSADDSYNTLNYSVSLTQPVLNLNAWHTLTSSEKNTLRAQAVYLSAQQDLILDVATAYFAVLREQENLTAAKALEAAVKRQYEQAKEQFDVGLIAITDVHEAKASYDDSKTNRIRSEGNLTLAIESLSRLTGQYADELYSLKDDFPIQMDTSASAESWVASAYENNLSIKTAEFAMESLKADLDASKAGHYPTLNLSAGYEYTDLTNFAPVDNESEDSNIFLNLNVPLYSGGATQAAVRQTRYQLEQARYQLEAAKRQARIATRTEYINLGTNIQTVEALQQNIVSRESALEATREGYKVGTRNIVEVLDAERSYFTALRDYANARFDFVESNLRIRLAAGTLSEQDLVQLNQWLEPEN